MDKKPLSDAEIYEAKEACVELGECTASYHLVQLISEVERLKIACANLKEEVEQGPGRRKHTHEWYERHYGKLHDWARKILPEPFRTQFFSCIANGVYGHDDTGKPYKAVAGFMVIPSGYFKMDTAQEQILFDQCVRAEDAEAEIAALKEESQRMNLKWEKAIREELESYPHDNPNLQSVAVSVIISKIAGRI